MPTILVEGATSAEGRVTGRTYRLGAGETQKYRVPEGEEESFPQNRFTILDDHHAEDRVVDPGPVEDGAEEEDTDGVQYASAETGRHYTKNRSWKTFYEDGEEAGKAQCSDEEAEEWVDGDITLSDLK